jgi:hypothetical protein
MLSMPMPLLTFRLHEIDRSIDVSNVCVLCHTLRSSATPVGKRTCPQRKAWCGRWPARAPYLQRKYPAQRMRGVSAWSGRRSRCGRWRRRRQRRGDGGWVSNHNSLGRDLVHLAAGGREAGAHNVGSRHHELDRSSVHLHLGKDVGIWRSRASDLELGQKGQKRQRRDDTFVQKTEGGIVGAISDVEEEHGLIHHHKVDVALAARLEGFGSLRGSSPCT